MTRGTFDEAPGPDFKAFLAEKHVITHILCLHGKSSLRRLILRMFEARLGNLPKMYQMPDVELSLLGPRREHAPKVVREGAV